MNVRCEMFKSKNVSYIVMGAYTPERFYTPIKNGAVAAQLASSGWQNGHSVLFRVCYKNLLVYTMLQKTSYLCCRYQSLKSSSF